jgi:hypothetical protein
MGALGWSDGAGPSSVVCAKTLIEKAPLVAKVKTTKIARSLFFIRNLF